MSIGQYYKDSDYIKKQRIAKLGEKNPNWKGGKSRGYAENRYRPIALSLKQQCSMCASSEKLCAHHIDRDILNNNLDNLQIVCRGCHNKIHKTKEVLK